MRVELRFFATVREAVGARTVEREFAASTTVGDVLGTLEAEFPDLEGRLLEADAIADSVTVLRNGTNVTHEAGAGTELADEDRLSITPPVTGG
jgi:molybdopterin synthase sulfur carrier subunit